MANSKAEKRLKKYLVLKKDVKNKLQRLKNNPHKEIGSSFAGKIKR